MKPRLFYLLPVCCRGLHVIGPWRVILAWRCLTYPHRLAVDTIQWSTPSFFSSLIYLIFSAKSERNTKEKNLVLQSTARAYPKPKVPTHFGCIPFDQSESGFFNRKLDQIADQLEHKIRKRICFHEVTLKLLVSGSCNQSRMRSIDQMERTIQDQFRIPIWRIDICLWGWIDRIAVKWNEKSNFPSKNSEWSKGVQALLDGGILGEILVEECRCGLQTVFSRPSFSRFPYSIAESNWRKLHPFLKQYLPYRSCVPDWGCSNFHVKGPFTLAIFASILAAISRKLLAIQIATESP